MQPPVSVPTPQALADLVARCDQINRYATELIAAEEARIAALASGILVMRKVLELSPVPAEKLPMRQGRIEHWLLTGRHVAAVETPAIHALDGTLALDEHEQVKILSRRTWRGVWRVVTLWRAGVHGLSSAALLEYLAALTQLAQQRAPDAAKSLYDRSVAIAATQSLLAVAPRTRAD
jgi:anti-sigma-K factor RskA